MVAIHRITEDLGEDTFQLVALHSSLEDYALVYALNLHLKTNFKRTRGDLETMAQNSFPIFEWRDKANDAYWTLIKNQSTIEENIKVDGLFEGETSVRTYHFLPEHKEVDYLIKIEQDGMDLDSAVVRELNTMPRVMTAYTIDPDTLKSKKNLIF